MVSDIYRNLNLALQTTVVILVVILALVIVQWLHHYTLRPLSVIITQDHKGKSDCLQDPTLSPAKKP